MCALMLGPRRDTAPGHNVVLTFIGASLLWVGWFGFNAGSATSAGMQAGMAMTVTQIATAAAGLAWMFFEWAHRGKATLIGICSGAVAGLVAITPASGFVGPVGSLVIGIVAGIICYAAVTWLKHACGYDDALDCFGVHAVGGAAGAVLTGVFAIQAYGGTAGWIEGNGIQVINQIKGVLVVAIYDAIVSLIILKVVDVFIGLRVGKEIEVEGLDVNLHGETVQ
jgi:Amt family ammonium transporter